jgi:hypothetical protein
MRVKGCKQPALSDDGTTAYITLELDDAEREIELELPIPSVVGPIIGRLLQLAGSAALARRTAQGEKAPVPVGVVPVVPQNIGFRLSGPGQVSLGLQYGVLNLVFPVQASELQAMADFLSTQARLLASEPGRPQ